MNNLADFLHVSNTLTTQFEIHETVNKKISDEDAKANKILNDEIGGEISVSRSHFLNFAFHYILFPHLFSRLFCYYYSITRCLALD
jgi:hypothetical protein